MKKNRFIRLLIAVGLMALPLMANADNTRFIITTKDGTVAEFYLDDDPLITYQNNLLVAVSRKHEISVNAADVASFVFSSESVNVGIEGLQSTSTLNGLVPGTAVQVFAIDGKLITNTTVSEEGKVDINFNNLPEGIFVIKTAKTSFKIMNKNK